MSDSSFLNFSHAESYDHRANVLQATVGSMMEADRLIVVTGEAIEGMMSSAVSQARSGDSAGAASNAQQVASSVEHILHVASAEMENSEDPAFTGPIDVRRWQILGRLSLQSFPAPVHVTAADTFLNPSLMSVYFAGGITSLAGG